MRVAAPSLAPGLDMLLLLLRPFLPRRDELPPALPLDVPLLPPPARPPVGRADSAMRLDLERGRGGLEAAAG